MDGVQTARFCHNRKDAEATYLPVDDALYSLKDGSPRGGRLDLGGWGVADGDMSAVAKVRRIGLVGPFTLSGQGSGGRGGGYIRKRASSNGTDLPLCHTTSVTTRYNVIVVRKVDL